MSLILHTYEVMALDKRGRLTRPYYPGTEHAWGTIEFDALQRAERWIRVNWTRDYERHNIDKLPVIVKRAGR